MTKADYKLRQPCLSEIPTTCCSKYYDSLFYKLQQSSYKLRQALQITTEHRVFQCLGSSYIKDE